MKRKLLIKLAFTSMIIFSGLTADCQNIFPSSANVGVGTTSPRNKLEVRDGSGLPQLKLSYNDSLYADIRVQNNGSLLFKPKSGSTYFNADSVSNSFYAFDNASDFNGSTYLALSAKRLQLITGGVALTDISSNGQSLFNGGNVGIGTTLAESKLHIKEPENIPASLNIPSFFIEGYNGWGSGLTLKNTTSNKSFGMFVSTNGNWHFTDKTNNLDRFFISSTGSVGIGTTNVDTSFKLFVEKGIRTRKIKIDQVNWPDYVFHSTYKLRSLPLLEAYINQNKHLPDFPSAKDVEANGVDLGTTQATLLRKIEELTLYVIELHKSNERLSRKIAKLENSNQKKQK